jgi:hypothetical protein
MGQIPIHLRSSPLTLLPRCDREQNGNPVPWATALICYDMSLSPRTATSSVSVGQRDAIRQHFSAAKLTICQNAALSENLHGLP